MKVGDVVRLTSGGPSMTVIELAEPKLSCTWFMVDSINGSSFPSASLELAADFASTPTSPTTESIPVIGRDPEPDLSPLGRAP